MTVERVECFALLHTMERPRGPSIWIYKERSAAIVKITDSGGLVGWGETYLETGVFETLEAIGRLLIGRDPLRARENWTLAWQASQNSVAVSAISIALDDLRGKLLGLPIAGLYGGAFRDRVRAYASSGGYFGDTDPAETWPGEMQEHLSAGFTAIKLRLGRWPVSHELPLVEKIRAELPASVELMADGNAAYTLPKAIDMGHGLARLGFRWWEEPIPQTDYAGYERLHAALPDVALAGGEGTETRGQARAYLGRNLFDIIQPDVSIVGGVGEMQFVADLARLHAVEFVPHMWGGALMVAATLQVLAITPDPTRSPSTPAPLLEYDQTENPFREHLLVTPFRMEDGWFRIPTGPGLGVEVDEAFVRASAREVRVVATGA